MTKATRNELILSCFGLALVILGYALIWNSDWLGQGYAIEKVVSAPTESKSDG